MLSYEAPVANSDESGDTTGSDAGSAGSGSGSTDSSSSTTGNDGGNNDNGSGNTGSESGNNTGGGSSNTGGGSSTTGSDGGSAGSDAGSTGSGGGSTDSSSGNTGSDGGSTGSESGDGETTPTTDCTHTWSAPTWAWSADYSVATATFTCTKCTDSQTIKAANITTSTEYSGCYVYTTYTATVTGPDEKGYSDSKTTNCRRSDWYYDRTYYTPCRPVWCDTSYTACGPCGHWGCGNVCTRYSSCTPCKNYTPTFRVGGYSCLATPKTGDASVIAPAMLALIGAAGAVLGKKRK